MFKTFKIYTKQQNHYVDIIEKALKANKKKQVTKNPDLLISVGGDGTFLKAARDNYYSPSTLYVSLKSGKLGFYSDYSVNEVDVLLQKLLDGDFFVEKIPLIKASWTNGHCYAINEVKVINSKQTTNIEILINGEYFETLRCSGIYVSSAQGSTGFNRSCHGPIIYDSYESIIFGELNSVNSVLQRSLQNPLVLKNKNELIFRSLDNECAIIPDNLEKNFNSNNTDILMTRSSKMINILRKNHFNRLKKIKESFITLK